MSSRSSMMILVLVAALQGKAAAQDKHGQAELNQSLREAINVGANLYNTYGDHAGCYRIYQGALIAVKPFVPADLQKKIDSSLEKAEKKTSFSDRAFELRAIIDEIRERTKVAAAPPSAAKDEVKETPPKATPEAKATTPGAGDRAVVSGKVSYDGQPLPGGYFVALVSEEGRSYSSAVQKGGSFEFRTPLPPGKYRIQIETFLEKEAPPTSLEVPARYRNAATSGLTVQLQPGARFLDVNLVK